MSITKLNPMDRLKEILSYNKIEGVPDYITYDENVNNDFDYELTASSSHDGTILFTLSLIEKVMVAFLNKQVIDPSKMSEVNKLNDIKYSIGDITIESEYGVKVKHFTGMKDTLKIPVKFEYVYK